MCVTAGPAILDQTLAYTYATLLAEDPRTEHITGYMQTSATNLMDTPNMMILHFPGDDITLVDGPQRTKSFMQDLTGQLPSLEPILQTRGRASYGSIQAYGDYCVVIAEEADDILSALGDIPEEARPEHDQNLDDLISFYTTRFPSYGYVLACWSGRVVPKHPIVVKYVPHNNGALFVPGLEGHDGRPPSPGEDTNRNFRIAFAADGYKQPFHMDGRYRDGINPTSCEWAPHDVTGFFDNRAVGHNTDYIVPLESVVHGYCGWELFNTRF